ncbi:MAG: response regulator [Planctomycetota bacterium]|jgi:CheY-like chemotaxis protein
MISVEEGGERGMAIGAVDFLRRPFSLERLDSLLERCGLRSEGGDVLLAEHDLASRHVIARLLERAQVPWREATNGAEAIRLIDDHEPGLILLDLLMPEVDGFGVIDWLKRTSRERIPVVVLIAKDVTGGEWELLERRVLQVVQQGSLGPDELAAEVARLVRLRIPKDAIRMRKSEEEA